MARNTAPDFGNGSAPKRYPNQKPKPAASLVLVDNCGPAPKFLMGRRSMKHVFMPGFYVFPGGKLETADRNFQSNLPESDQRLLRSEMSKAPGAHALLGCALRETREETGINLHGTALKARYLARAITPPGHIRRYDTRFFIALADSSALSAQSPTDNELLSISWMTMDEMPEDRIHRVTNLVLHTALKRLEADSALCESGKRPVFRIRYGKAVTEYD